jgi:ligand-binding sensor domain-containing protein
MFRSQNSTPARRSARWPAAFAIFVLCSPCLDAQRYTFKYYDQAQNLTNLAVQCMLQDQTGFLWVGTQNGLFLFAGDRFRRYDRNDGIPSSFVNSLHQSRDGVLWIGTRAGLARYNGSRFEPIPINTKYEILSTSAITSDDAGVVYVGTTAGLLAGHLDASKAGHVFGLVQLPESVSQQRVSAVHASPSGVWFGCGTGICAIRSGRVSIFGPESGVPSQRWDAMVTDAAGQLWIRSSTRLLMLPRGGRRFITYDAGLPEASEFGSMYVSKQGQLFVATDRGLAFRQGGRWEFIDASRGLATDGVSCVFEDREGSVWLGLRGSGIARWLGNREWEAWTRAEGARDVLSNARRSPGPRMGCRKPRIGLVCTWSMEALHHS